MMEINHFHGLTELFEQLGLPADNASIQAFIQQHRPLPRSVFLHQASWWTASQAEFLQNAIAEDADWAEIVDKFSELLR